MLIFKIHNVLKADFSELRENSGKFCSKSVNHKLVLSLYRNVK